MKKILFTTEPLIKTYPSLTNVLATIPVNNTVKFWIYERYLNLSSPSVCDNAYINFAAPAPWIGNPFMQNNKLNRRFLRENHIDFIHFIKYSINLGYYVLLYLNHKHLSCSDVFEREDRHHDVMIYGYDEEEKKVHIADFFTYGQYSFEKVSFSEILNAFETVHQPYTFTEVDAIISFRFNPIPWYKTDPEKIKEQLKEYLKGTHKKDSLSNQKSSLYGINTYNTLENCILNLKEKAYLDKRGFSILLSHKELLYDCLKSFNISYNEEDLKDLIKLNKIILTQVLKYNIKKEPFYLAHILIKLRELKTLEKLVFENILNNFEIYCSKAL